MLGLAFCSIGNTVSRRLLLLNRLLGGSWELRIHFSKSSLQYKLDGPLFLIAGPSTA